MTRIHLSVAFVAMSLAACTSVQLGTEVSPDRVGEIERGVTTRSDIQRIFGDPTSIRIHSSGLSVWRYSYEEVKATDTGTLTRLLCTVGVLVRIPACLFGGVNYREGVTTRDELTVRFDEENLVASYTYVHEEIPVSGVYDPAVGVPRVPADGRIPSRQKPTLPTRGVPVAARAP